MAVTNPFHSLAAIAARLPFHLNETDKVNAAFRRWRRYDDDQAKYHVDLWTYCFIRRYFLVKFTRDHLYNNAADMEALIEQAHARVQQRQAMVSETARYASWVSVVCKHAFLNYLRTLQVVVSIDQDAGLQLPGEPIAALHDAGMVYEGLRRAIERLPGYLREVAHLRFARGISYHAIEQFTGKPLPTVRSYVYKAALKLRADPLFRAYLGKD